MRLTQGEVISRLKNLQQSGAIRRFGARMLPRDIGLPASAMVAWKVPDSRVQEVGEYFSGFKEMTHCYEREIVPGKWEYNLYTVLHSRNRGRIKAFVKQLSENLGIPEYLILFSKANLKTSEPYSSGIVNSSKT
jgi:DNA-binding Lrp family transcriptional regulator